MAKDGTIDRDRPVAAWRTSLHLPGGAEARVTLGDLLSQRTGLTKNAYDDRLEAGQSPALLRASLADAPLQCEPGRSEEQTSELQSLMRNSYAFFCLKKKNKNKTIHTRSKH